MQRRTADIVAELKKHLAAAKEHHAAAEQASATREDASKTELERAWLCGKELNYLKSQRQHGNWLPFIENNWPELGTSTRELYMKIDRENPNARRVGDLKHDSIRKYRLSSVPKKPRPAEPGDATFSKPEHHSTVVNECARFWQRYDAGQVKADEEELRTDWRPHYERLQRLYGDA